MSLEEEIEELTDQIMDLEASREILRGRLAVELAKKLSGDDKLLIAFQTFVTAGGGSQHPDRIEILARSGRDFLGDQGFLFEPHKDFTYEVSEFGVEMFDEWEHSKKHGWHNDYTAQDMLDWMRELIERDIGSITWSW